MELLTGECLRAYNNWIQKEYPEYLINENCGYSYGMFERDLEQLTYVLPKSMNNALIIDFFDSVGIIIDISIARLSQDNYGFTATIWTTGFRKFYYIENHKTRQQATNEAIKKANLIYNGL